VLDVGAQHGLRSGRTSTQFGLLGSIYRPRWLLEWPNPKNGLLNSRRSRARAMTSRSRPIRCWKAERVGFALLWQLRGRECSRQFDVVRLLTAIPQRAAQVPESVGGGSCSNVLRAGTARVASRARVDSAFPAAATGAQFKKRLDMRTWRRSAAGCRTAYLRDRSRQQAGPLGGRRSCAWPTCRQPTGVNWTISTSSVPACDCRSGS